MSGKIYTDWPTTRRHPRTADDAFRDATYASAITPPPVSLFGHFVELLCWAAAVALLASVWFTPQLWEMLK
jgi:hypothetical protein